MIAITQILLAGLITIAVQALPQAAKSSAAPSATPTPASTIELARGLLTEPSALLRFKKLLTVDGKLLTGNTLKERTIFDFTKAPAVGKGGRVISAVRSPYVPLLLNTLTTNTQQNVQTFPILTDLGISTTVAFLSACGINSPHGMLHTLRKCQS
jgi:hypothetical protein